MRIICLSKEALQAWASKNSCYERLICLQRFAFFHRDTLANYVDISGDSKDIPDYAKPDAGIVLANFPSIISPLTLILPNRAIITYPAKNKNSKYNDQVKKWSGARHKKKQIKHYIFMSVYIY